MNSVTWLQSRCARPEVLASWLFGDSSCSEAWLIRRIRSSRLTRQRALWYLSSLGQAQWNWLSEDSANVSQGRTGQDRAGWEQNKERKGYFLDLSPSDILVDRTRVSACPICPIKECTFVWHNFSPYNFVFKFVMYFENFFHQIFLNSHLCSHVCSQCHQSSSAAFSEWLPKQWCSNVL